MYGKKRPDLVKRNKEHPPCLSGERNGMYGRRGEDNPNYGRKLSKEVKQHLSDVWDYDKHVTEQFLQKQKRNNAYNYEHKLGWYSKEAKAKVYETRIKNGTLHMSESAKKKMSESAHKKSVKCVETGEIYASTIAAEKATGIWHSHISGNCNGRLKYTTKDKKHYHWEYVEGDNKC